jgi:predicted RND superfamily exporter protein
MISGVFGEQNQAVIMVPLGHFESEAELSEVLGKKDYVKSVQSISALADPAIPIEFLPTELTENFVSEDYARIILMLDVPLESEETFGAVEDLENTISEYYEEYYLAGNSTAIYDIKQVVETDYQTVNTISIIAVMLIILFVFRSLSLPFILTFVIEVAIWLNMAIPYFAGSTLSFVGYLIISSVQLGATIDYAILLADRYMEFRETLPKREAAIEAVVSAGGSIFTSFLILGSAGLSLGFISQTAAISELGILIGRGAFISGIMVLTLLPALLVLFDGAIMRTTLTSEKLAARSKRKGRE